jgi:phage terminase small subunit
LRVGVPPLANPRHERFVQALFEGKSADEAYMKAGYSENRGNASRLKANENILARLTELQAAAAKASEVTVQSLLNELEAAREKASNLDQLSAAVRAIEAKAKVSGLLVQKVEVGSVGDFDGCETVEAVAERMARDMSGKELPPEELDGFTKLVTEWFEQGDKAMHEYLASCTAKPVQPVSGRNLEAVERSYKPARMVYDETGLRPIFQTGSGTRHRAPSIKSESR